MPTAAASPLVATPRPRSVRDSWGDPCSKAEPESYPLTARCENCGESLRCADATAAWTHKMPQLTYCP